MVQASPCLFQETRDNRRFPERFKDLKIYLIILADRDKRSVDIVVKVGHRAGQFAKSDRLQYLRKIVDLLNDKTNMVELQLSSSQGYIT